MQTMIRWAIAATQGRSPLLDNRIISSLRTVRRNLPAVDSFQPGQAWT